MNERIKELATEVGISVEYLNNTKQWLLIETLAELIVADVDKIIDDLYQSLPLEQAAILLTLDERIKEHFKVEGSL